MISPSLRLEVTQVIFLKSIEGNSVFKGKVQIITFMTKNMAAHLFMPEDFVLMQDETANHIFFLSKGSCNVYVQDVHDQEQLVRTLENSAIFGELALITHCKRTASVQSKDYCTLAALEKEAFYEMCSNFPDTFFRLKMGC